MGGLHALDERHAALLMLLQDIVISVRVERLPRSRVHLLQCLLLAGEGALARANRRCRRARSRLGLSDVVALPL